MMQLRNTPHRWGAVAQFLHWSVALGVIGLACVGLLMDDLPLSLYLGNNRQPHNFKSKYNNEGE
jgi:cytochrome b561